MKQTITVRHTEMIVQPGCRKARPVEGVSEITVNIREVTSERAPVAFIVSEYDHEPCKVRLFKGKLYRQLQNYQPQYRQTFTRDESLPMWLNTSAATFQFPDQDSAEYDKRWKEWLYPTLADSKKSVRETAAQYIIVDGEVYVRSGEPYYCVACFGLGNNHGGTGFFIGWSDFKIRKNIWGMTPADKPAAIEKAIKIALNRGDTESVELISSSTEDIKVLIPEAIKRKYAQ